MLQVDLQFVVDPLGELRIQLPTALEHSRADHWGSGDGNRDKRG